MLTRNSYCAAAAAAAAAGKWRLAFELSPRLSSSQRVTTQWSVKSRGLRTAPFVTLYDLRRDAPVVVGILAAMASGVETAGF